MENCILNIIFYKFVVIIKYISIKESWQFLGLKEWLKVSLFLFFCCYFICIFLRKYLYKIKSSELVFFYIVNDSF